LAIVLSINDAGMHRAFITLHLFALAIKPHATTEPTGARATRIINTRAIQ